MTPAWGQDWQQRRFQGYCESCRWFCLKGWFWKRSRQRQNPQGQRERKFPQKKHRRSKARPREIPRVIQGKKRKVHTVKQNRWKGSKKRGNRRQDRVEEYKKRWKEKHKKKWFERKKTTTAGVAAEQRRVKSDLQWCRMLLHETNERSKWGGLEFLDQFWTWWLHKNLRPQDKKCLQCGILALDVALHFDTLQQKAHPVWSLSSVCWQSTKMSRWIMLENWMETSLPRESIWNVAFPCALSAYCSVQSTSLFLSP